MVAEAPEVRNTRALTVVEIEAGWILKGRTVQKRPIAGVEIALVLRKRIGSLQGGGYTGDLELTGHVADTRSEEQRRPGLDAKNAVQPPPSQNFVRHASAV